MKILWLIAARSGSKSIPDKNIKLLGGRPLISYRIDTAKKSHFENEIWLSTDSSKYAKIGQELGAKIPFLRPKELASDDASSSDVVLHAMEYANMNNYKFDFVGLLEPTSPFISTEQLDNALERLLLNTSADSIVAVKEQRPNSFFIQPMSEYLSTLAVRFNQRQKLRRQNFPSEMTPSGGFYISRWNSFMQSKTFYTPKTLAYIVDDFSGLEIDDTIDWLFGEFLLNHKTK